MKSLCFGVGFFFGPFYPFLLNSQHAVGKHGAWVSSTLRAVALPWQAAHPLRGGGPAMLMFLLVSSFQMDSAQLIHCRELVAHHLSTLQSSLLPNPVYVYSPLQHTLVTCNRGAFKCQPSSVPGPGFSKDNGRPEVPVTATAALYQRLPAPSGCKQASAKRKVEEMEVDDFYDGIKRLYNEDAAPEVVALENMGSVCGADVSRQEGNVSPCPPLQPVSVM